MPTWLFFLYYPWLLLLYPAEVSVRDWIAHKMEILTLFRKHVLTLWLSPSGSRGESGHRACSADTEHFSSVFCRYGAI